MMIKENPIPTPTTKIRQQQRCLFVNSIRIIFSAVLLLQSTISTTSFFSPNTGSFDVSTFQGRRGRILERIRIRYSKENKIIQSPGHLLLETKLNAIIPNHFEFVEAANAATVNTLPFLTKIKLQSNAPPILQLKDYSPAATSLFNNIKLPAAVVTAGMISLGFATSFPTLPQDTEDRIYSPKLRERCESLNRLHIVVSLLSVTSELICVIWAAIEVNQLTERFYEPALSVWDLIQRDCDLAWSGVNSHFVIGIIGFVTMLAIRAYVMLIAASASKELMTAASSGTIAAFFLMISIANRGVEAGGGNGIRYGSTVFDLFQHYAQLLLIEGADVNDPGPLQLLSIGFEIISLTFALNVLLNDNGKMEYIKDDSNILEEVDDEYCQVVDIDENHIYLVHMNGNNKNGASENLNKNGASENLNKKSEKDAILAQKCSELKNIGEEEMERKSDDDSKGDSSVSIV